jgi:glycosyltransferase involved in cell wall biosynthesis
MRILEVSRYKNNFADHQLPFVTEQGAAIAKVLRDMQNDGMIRDKSLIDPLSLNDEPLVDYFLVKGNYITAVRELKKKIREFKPDIVHAHFGLSAITAELQSEVPVVTTFHNGETLNWHVNLMSSLFSLRAKHVIYVAQHIRDLSYFKAKNYSIIPCGVPMEQMVITPKEEARRQLGWDPDKKYILFGGAFDNERKNYKLLAEAVDILEKENNKENTVPENNQENNITKKDESKVTCSNSNSLDPQSAQKQAFGQPDAQSCSDTDKSYPLDSSEKNPSLHDSQKNPKNIVCVEMKGLSREECVLRMCGADLFALPSHSEGSPQALKEAMAVNCPCLATDIADVRELFGDEPGHWILRNPRKTHERWDADEKSLDEMVQLLHEALMYEGRTKGRERILELGLSNEQVAKKIVKIYNDILTKLSSFARKVQKKCT